MGTPMCSSVLLVWLSMQFMLLLAAALGGPWLSAAAQSGSGDAAIQLMLGGQVALSALLFPLLLRSVRCSVLVIVTSWPFIQLAGLLSATPPARLIGAALYLGVWLAGLALWSAVLRSRKAQLTGVAIAVALTLGGPLLWYVGAEFGGRPAEARWAAGLGPLMGALTQARELLPSPWLFLLAWVLSALAGRALRAALTAQGRRQWRQIPDR